MMMSVCVCVCVSHSGMGPNTIEAILTRYPTPMSLDTAYQQTIRQARQAGRDPNQPCCELLAQLPLPAETNHVWPRGSRDVFDGIRVW